MTVIKDCDAWVEFMFQYVDNALPQDEHAAVEAHLKICEGCRDSVKRLREIRCLVDSTVGSQRWSTDFAEKTSRRLKAIHLPVTASGSLPIDAPPGGFETITFLPDSIELNWGDAQTDSEPKPEQARAASLTMRFSSVPWWGVSILLHVLVIVLASLISMSIGLSGIDDCIIMVTELQALPAEIRSDIEKPKVQTESPLASKHDTPPTDPTSRDASDIVVPFEILKLAELCDHFETINPDRPDTQSAFGNPDALMFHSVAGNDEPAGGGGAGGTELGDLIGIGGAAIMGSGSGWGGGSGTGIGIGNGAGCGSFGQRTGGGRKLMVKKHGGSKATESAVDLALQWLAYHQEADGHWNTKKYGARRSADTSMTSLALLAFLGAGHTEKVGQYKGNVNRAVAWLKSIQHPNGLIFDTTEPTGHEGYSTAMATMAMAEAAGMAKVKETRDAAQRAVNYCTEIHQQGEGSEKGAWRYRAKVKPDLSNSGWFIMALKSAKVAGLQVNPASFEGAKKFLDSVEIKGEALRAIVDTSGVDTTYRQPSEYLYQVGGCTGPMMWSAGNLCRLFMGVDKEELQSSIELIVKRWKTPNWDNVSLYYWYYGTLCVFQEGGDVWKHWNEDLKSALVEHQRKDGDESGSWDLKGTFSEEWGRVGQTALACLCLEVYYRYLQLAPDNK